MRKIISSLLFCFFTLSAAMAQLTAPEKKAIAYINDHMDATMQLLIESVNINSGTLNIAGVKKVGELYARQLEKLGFIIEWVAEPDSLHRAGHLVAVHKGKKGKKLFLIGHLDTVFEPDMPAGPYTVLDDSTAANAPKSPDTVRRSSAMGSSAAGLHCRRCSASSSIHESSARYGTDSRS